MTDATSHTPALLERATLALLDLALTLPTTRRMDWQRAGTGVGAPRVAGGPFDVDPNYAAWAGRADLEAAMTAVAHAPAFAQGPRDYDFYAFNFMAHRDARGAARGWIQVRQQGGVFWNSLARPEADVVHFIDVPGVAYPDGAVERGDAAALHAVARDQRRHDRGPDYLRFDPLEWGFAMGGVASRDETGADRVCPRYVAAPGLRVSDPGRSAVARLMATAD